MKTQVKGKSLISVTRVPDGVDVTISTFGDAPSTASIRLPSRKKNRK